MILMGGLWIPIIFAVVDLIAVLGKKIRLQYVTKPAVMLSLLIWMLSHPGLFVGKSWFILGLLFGLIGDILLLLPGRFFLFGLGSFLVGHLSYILYFQPWQSELSVWFILFIIAVILTAIIYLRKICPYLLTKRGARRLHVLVIIYCFFLSLMLISAFATISQPEWSIPAILPTCFGAILFFVSDCLLGFDRFVKSFWGARFFVRTTYYMGQILLASAVIIRIN